ncbi:MAG: histidine kinase [Ramlibacter sp.]|jgi:signal transduction histidine kinase
MRIDWVNKLQHLLQTIAFCLAIATIQYAFAPERPYAPPVAYSVCIGIYTWAFIDLGRELFPSARETGWPAGMAGVLLVVGGIAVGYLLGNATADLACRTFGWYAGALPLDRTAELRNSILITVMAGLVGTYYFYSRSKGAYLERKMSEANQHANEARLKLLETQLEPHMLFNTLANLRVLIGIEPARAQTMLDHMIAYLRATLDASRASAHPLRDEFARLRDYLELMSIRMGPRLAYQLDLPDALGAQPVPTLLLQPLVENAIKHGLEPKVEGGSITVSARQDGADLVLEVADTGVGMTDTAQASSGFGTAQVRERLATVYGPAAAIDFIAPHAGGVRVSVRFPLKP